MYTKPLISVLLSFDEGRATVKEVTDALNAAMADVSVFKVTTPVKLSVRQHRRFEEALARRPDLFGYEFELPEDPEVKVADLMDYIPDLYAFEYTNAKGERAHLFYATKLEW